MVYHYIFVNCVHHSHDIMQNYYLTVKLPSLKTPEKKPTPTITLKWTLH